VTDFTNTELQACAEREAKMRHRVYPRWVADERMTQKQADAEISKMEAIAAHFAALAEKERLL
jgi:hypothetical protein